MQDGLPRRIGMPRMEGKPMDDKELNRRIDAYLDAHWEEVVADIDALVRIPSVEDKGAATEGAPFGLGPREALTAVLGMAERMGFDAHDLDGFIGYADHPGRSDGQIGVIGHVDVVPAFEPYAVTCKDGYLIGRGVADDKGPVVVALHALKFWKDLQDVGTVDTFPYTVRFLFGANEETGMGDLPAYQSRFDDPLFLFTPDAEFPVSYGEKGLYSGVIRSPRLYAGSCGAKDAGSAGAPLAAEPGAGPDSEPDAGSGACRIVAFEGGAAANAVPGTACAVVRADAAALPAVEGIAVEAAACDGLARIVATGRSAHASTPEKGVSAILLLVGYLLDNGICNEAERAFLELDRRLVSRTDGSGVGIACADEHFGALTVVGGTAYMEDGFICQTLDVRFPTSTTPAELTGQLARLAQDAGCSYEALPEAEAEPFLVDPSSPMIQALLSAYNEATGEHAEPFTMGGATYARHFASAASFGPALPHDEAPAWVGGMHGPDEGVSEESLKKAFRIYALTIGKLMDIDFDELP